MKIIHIVILPISLLFLCSCVGIRIVHFDIPSDVAMNKDAGRGGLIIVNLHLKGGEELPFVVDTGMPVTILDTSLEPKLGKCWGTNDTWNFGRKVKVKVYAAPDLYLGKSFLPPANFIATADCKPMSEVSGRPIMGILGMDVLHRYCVQLDFSTNKIRFLNYWTDQSKWGKRFRLSGGGFEHYSIKENLVGTKGSGSYIDTGCNDDGRLLSGLYQQWTNHLVLATNGEARFPNGVLDGEVYTQLDLSTFDRPDPTLKNNIIGLHFLSRNLVTLDFPQKRLYLKRTSIAPLSYEPKEVFGFGNTNSILGFLHALKEKGQLPGWSKDDHGELSVGMAGAIGSEFPSESFEFRKNGDPGVYHYAVIRTSENGSFKLQRAWQTDTNGNVIKEFPIQ